MEKIMRKTKRNRISAIFLTLAMVLWCMAGVMGVLIAKAADTGSLTLWCVKDDDIVSNMHWQIYRVGHRVTDDYIFEGDFAGYRATLGDKTKPMLEWDTDTVATAGETLKVFSIVDKIDPRADGYTNSSGAVTFDGLENGLYLVWGDILKVGDTTYIPSAIFFEMRGDDASVLNAYPKIVLRTLSTESYNYSVRKVWENDEDQPWNRAVSITVERYRDNKYYDEIELSENNEWTFEWEDSDDHNWFVNEKVIPENYTVSYKDNHTQYLIINTYDSSSSSSKTDIQTTVTTDGNWTDTQTTTVNTTADNNTHTSTGISTALNSTATHTSTNSSNSTNSNNTTANNNTTPKSSTRTTNTQTTSIQTTVTEEKVPQTGQLWWPVPGLAVGGMLFFGMGLRITKKDDEE